jgi:hypothetical protein
MTDKWITEVNGKPIWHVTIPAIALVPAATAEEAEAILAEAIERAGLHAYEEDRRVFESEPVLPGSLFVPRTNPFSS